MDNAFFEPELDLGAEDGDSDSSRYVEWTHDKRQGSARLVVNLN